MMIVVTDQLRAEAKRMRLLYSCFDCALFEPDTKSCSHGYPNAQHLHPVIDEQCEVVFCKEFELG